MSNRDQLKLMIARVGLKILLTELIEILDVQVEKHNEEYIIKLRDDLKLTLNNYENRYEQSNKT